MEEITKVERRGGNHGGGRPKGNRTVQISLRISPEAAEILAMQKNKAEFIDNLIIQSQNE